MQQSPTSLQSLTRHPTPVSLEMRLRLALDAAQLGAWDVDLVTHRITFDNLTAGMYGYAPDTFPGTPAAALQRVHPDDLAQMTQLFERAVQERSLYSCEYRTRWPDGSVRWLVSRGQALYDADGQAYAVTGVVCDLTEKRLLQQTAEQAAAQLRLITDTAPISIVYIDAHERFRFANRCFEKVYHRTQDEIIGKTLRHFIGEATYVQLAPYARAALAGERVTFTLQRNLPADASRRIRAQYVPDVGPDGQVRGFVAVSEDITEKTAFEERLRAEQQRSQSILESITDGFMLVDYNWRFAYLNDTAARLMGSGQAKSAMLGQDIRTFFPPGTGAVFTAECRRAMQLQKPVAFTDHYLPDDIWFEVNVYPANEGLSVYFRDVTAKVRASQLLHDQQKWLQDVLNTLPVATALLEPQTAAVLFANEAMIELSGGPTAPDPAWYKHIRATNDRDEPLPDYATPGFRAAQGETLCGEPVVWHTPRGRFSLQANARTLSARYGQPGIAILALQDVTQLNQALSDRTKMEDRFKEIARATNLGVWYCDLPFDVLSWSREAKEQAWLSPDASVDVDVFKACIHPDDRRRVIDAVKRCVAENRPYEQEYRMVRPGHPEQIKWIRAIGWTRYDACGRAIQFDGISLDITEHQNTLHRLREAVRGRSELISICGHELKTPLVSLKLQTQGNQRRIRRGDASAFAPARIEHLLEVYGSQIDRLVRLVDDMLDVTRMEAKKVFLQREVVDLSQLVHAVLERFADQFGLAGMTVHTQIASGVVCVADRFRIEQVMVNLLTNAMKYGRQQPIHVSLHAQAECAYIAVRDAGIGIAKEHQTRVMQRFERAIAASEISGLGLGLYIANEIVELHGGRIDIDSELGLGSTFTVCLPQLPVFNDVALQDNPLAALTRGTRDASGNEPHPVN